MDLRGVLREDILEPGDMPLYDKAPDQPAYFIHDDAIIVSQSRHRVLVPMAEAATRKASVDTLVFGLIQTVGDLGVRVTYDGTFDRLLDHFRSHDLPLACLIRSPKLNVPAPGDVKTLEWEAAPKDRFYCLTQPEHLGCMPIRYPGMQVFDVKGEPVLIEQRGFLIFNPAGILTVAVEA